jgi:hypothetical protein
VLTAGLDTGYMVIDLASKTKTITDDQGNDLWGYLTLDSDINRFRLEPDPIAPDGVNEISFILPGYTTDTLVTIDYNNRYLGI